MRIQQRINNACWWKVILSFILNKSNSYKNHYSANQTKALIKLHISFLNDHAKHINYDNRQRWNK